jgi:pimeloyl-ACP methyl ester carboxylesterase
MVARRHLLGCALVLSFVALGLTASSALALKFGSCPKSSQFRCATLTVPLDHSGKSPGTVKLRVAAQRRFPRGAGLIVALAGGPGQAAVPFADQFASSLSPMLRDRRLVVIDQRGTGSSGALSCPELQNLAEAAPLTGSLVRDCAQQIGSRRRFYSTLDSVADLDAVRAAFGARKVALMGVSYGTWVAEEYARVHPAKTESLILDSVVGPGQPSGFYLDGRAAIKRVTAEQCAARRCEGATTDPVGDLTAVMARVAAAPLRGQIYDSRGRARPSSYENQDEIDSVIIGGDLNAELRAQLPAAMAAARADDYAPLLRLQSALGGAALSARELSFGLNVITSCLDSELPYALSSSTATRAPLVASALSAINPSSYSPLTAESVLSRSVASDCLLFPTQFDTAPASGPLPNIPSLILAGQLDLRTPAENAAATAALIPKASLVRLRGAGHDVLGADTTGCVATALKRFAAGIKVGSPCANSDNGLRPVPLAPRKVADAKPASGVAGTRGRALSVAFNGVNDALSTAYMMLAAGVEPRGGGLRGGSFDASNGSIESLVLRGYRYASDLAVNGSLRLFSSGPRGTLTLSGASTGKVKITSWNSASGVIDGRAVSWNRPAGAAARSPSGPRAAPRIR